MQWPPPPPASVAAHDHPDGHAKQAFPKTPHALSSVPGKHDPVLVAHPVMHPQAHAPVLLCAHIAPPAQSPQSTVRPHPASAAFVQPDSTANKFGNDPTAGTISVPYAPGTDIRVNNTGINAQMAGTFTQDAGIVAASSTVWMSNHTYNAGITAGVTIGLYVLASDGVLRWYVNGGVPGVRVTGWLIASPPFPNF